MDLLLWVMIWGVDKKLTLGLYSLILV